MQEIYQTERALQRRAVMKNKHWRAASAVLLACAMIFTLPAGKAGSAAVTLAEMAAAVPSAGQQNIQMETQTDQQNAQVEPQADQRNTQAEPQTKQQNTQVEPQADQQNAQVEKQTDQQCISMKAQSDNQQTRSGTAGNSQMIQSDTPAAETAGESIKSESQERAGDGTEGEGETVPAETDAVQKIPDTAASAAGTENLSEYETETETETENETENETGTEEAAEVLTEEVTEEAPEIPLRKAAGKQRKVTIKNKGNLNYASYGFGSYTTGQYRVTIDGITSGAYGFCANPVFPSPTSGTYPVQNLNSYWLRIMYYGLKEYSGENNFFSRTGRGSWPSGKRYIIIHLSIAQRNNSHSLAMGATSAALSCADELYKYAGSHEAPTPDLSLTPSSVKAYKEGSIQRTPSMTLNGFVYNYITIQLPAAVRLVNETKKTTSAPGAAVKVYGRDQFYLTAPLDQARTGGKVYSSGSLAGNEQYRYAAWRVAESQQAKQDLAVIGRTLSPGAVSFDVTWLDSDNASIHIKKLAEETQSGERKVAGITFTLTSVNDPSVKVTLVTDANGEARAEHLKPGTYTISESAQNREYAALPDSKVVLENNKTLEYSVRNILERRTVKIQKLDAQTQTLITADKAEFQILDTAGKPVRLKVKGAENATGVFGTNENGEVLFEDKLSAGKYILHERKAPENYTTAEDIPFAVDADSPAEITLRSMDAPVMKKIRIIKKSEDGDTCGAGFRFLIKPSGDITDGSGNERKMEAQTVTTDESGTAVSGDLYPGTYLVTETAVPAGSGWTVNPQTYTVDVKGDPDSESEVTLSVSDSKNRFIICKHTAGEDSQPLENITFSVTEKGENTKPSLYRTGKDGRIELDGLSNGRTYEIREVETRPGYNLDPAVYTITVDNTGLIEGRREYTLDLSNQPNIVRFSKKDIVEGEDGAELPGAELIVKNEHGEKIDSWISTNKPHEITSLPAGKYELTERAAPEGYELSEQSVRFTVENSLSIQKVVMYDRPYREVDISKLDITTGEELPGASLEVTDSDGNRVDAWVSTGQPHRLTLPSGVYLLTEKIPAAGYTTAEAVTFEVKTAAEKGDIQVQNVQMKDAPTKIYIHKQDITTSKELPGAKLRITDKDGKTVEEWISTKKPHEIEKLPAGEYTLTEITAPDGYETAESVPFEVKDSSEALHVVMKDSPKIAPGTKEDSGTTGPAASSVSTGNDTPIGRYLAAMAASAFIFVAFLRSMRAGRRKERKQAGKKQPEKNETDEAQPGRT